MQETSGHVAAGCEGKQAFETWKDAERTAKRQSRRRKKRRVAPYRCRYCHKFHLFGCEER
ncbi:MAG: hypothetical protein QNJ92_17405 [Alphaproteobacteria bacterium]|nr:hypothetical protein [Alphaproteobacteria bacterium]